MTETWWIRISTWIIVAGVIYVLYRILEKHDE